MRNKACTLWFCVGKPEPMGTSLFNHSLYDLPGNSPTEANSAWQKGGPLPLYRSLGKHHLLAQKAEEQSNESPLFTPEARA